MLTPKYLFIMAYRIFLLARLWGSHWKQYIYNCSNFWEHHRSFSIDPYHYDYTKDFSLHLGLKWGNWRKEILSFLTSGSICACPKLKSTTLETSVKRVEASKIVRLFGLQGFWSLQALRFSSLSQIARYNYEHIYIMHFCVYPPHFPLTR